MRASTKRVGVCYKGAVRDDKGKVIWTCDHFHTNRDNDSYGYLKYRYDEGMSANTCAERHIRATNPL